MPRHRPQCKDRKILQDLTIYDSRSQNIGPYDETHLSQKTAEIRQRYTIVLIVRCRYRTSNTPTTICQLAARSYCSVVVRDCDMHLPLEKHRADVPSALNGTLLDRLPRPSLFISTTAIDTVSSSSIDTALTRIPYPCRRVHFAGGVTPLQPTRLYWLCVDCTASKRTQLRL